MTIYNQSESFNKLKLAWDDHNVRQSEIEKKCEQQREQTKRMREYMIDIALNTDLLSRCKWRLYEVNQSMIITDDSAFSDILEILPGHSIILEPGISLGLYTPTRIWFQCNKKQAADFIERNNLRVDFSLIHDEINQRILETIELTTLISDKKLRKQLRKLV